MLHGYAAYAVWGFYVLSGFLMTSILKDKYGFTRQGLKDYALNRFLRIMPVYWIAVLVGCATLLILGAKGVDLRKLNPQFAMPDTVMNWLFPITLFPAFPQPDLPVPVSGALGIEVGYYLLMPLFALNRWVAWTAALIGIVVNYRLGLGIESFPTRYSSFLPCILPFAMGSLIAHHRASLARWSFPWTSCSLWLLNGLLVLWRPGYPWRMGLYVSIVLSAWVTLSLAGQKSRRGDTFAGDLSYSVYLFHTTAAAWLIPWFGFDRPLGFCLLGLSLTLGISVLLLRWFEIPLRRFKRKPSHVV